MNYQKSVSNPEEIAKWRLCIGCGACAYFCPENNLRLKDFSNIGILPEIIRPEKCAKCAECLKVCPSYELDYQELYQRPRIIAEVLQHYGPVLEVWEGHASDSEIRFKGASGGAITALALYCLEKLRMHGVLHIGSDPANPVRNVTELSRNREELLQRSGSRYAPASACDKLHLIEQAPSQCCFIGRPAEVVALRKAQSLRPTLDRNVGLAISFFCAGTPPTKATEDLLFNFGVNSSELSSLRYRGHGWPGKFAATRKGETVTYCEMTYQKSWGILQAYRPYAMHLWPDDSGEMADISCGDPWYRKVEPGEHGYSLLVVRTELGRKIVKGAIDAGYLQLVPAESWKLIKSQHGFIKKRGAIWGRRLAFRALGLPVTKIIGLPLFKVWLNLSFIEKLKSTLGTVRRILMRGYFKKMKLTGDDNN